MAELVFLVFAVTCVALVWAAVAKPERVYEYPYFMGAAFGVFIVPQAVPLVKEAGLMEYSSVVATLLMCGLCLGMCRAGYRARPPQFLRVWLSPKLDSGKLLHAGVAFVAFGGFFYYKIAVLDSSAKEGAWTGIVTVYHFFATLIYPGFAFCLYSAVRRGTWSAWGLTALAALIPVHTAVFFARREPLLLFVLSVAMVLHFQRRAQLPRFAVVAVLGSAMLLIPATGDYRGYATESPIRAVRQIRPLKAFGRYFEPGADSEVRNAYYVIDAVRKSGDCRFGAGYWNEFVFRFVPAQLVGVEIKNSLTLPPGEPHSGERLRQLTLQTTAQAIPAGMTVTGVADSFWQFWYGGCVAFALVGACFKIVWTLANEQGLAAAQLLYIPLVPSALRMVTHGSISFLPGAVLSSVLVGMAIWYARCDFT